MKNKELVNELNKHPQEAEVLMGSNLYRIKDVIFIPPDKSKNPHYVGPLIVINPDKD